ncbi:unnamed protein product, partial [Symbiodinium necroappetens]
DEARQGRQVDLMCIPETSWREEMEFTTRALDGSGPQYHAIHTGNKEKAGLLCLIRQGLVAPDRLRFTVLQHGRLLHVRLLFEVPLDVLCVYQIAWNMGKQSLEASKRAEQLVQQRAKVWEQISQWVHQIPLRNGLMLLGDFNTPARTEIPWVGPGLMRAADPPQQDRDAFQAILKQADGRILNSWSQSGCPARTFLPPTAGPRTLGTQIDFIIVRAELCDPQARLARAFDAPFVPGCRHRPVTATVPMPKLPKHGPHRIARTVPSRAQKLMADDQVCSRMRQHVTGLEQLPNDPMPDLDRELMQGWSHVTQQHRSAGKAENLRLHDEGDLATSQLVRRMWLLRANSRAGPAWSTLEALRPLWQKSGLVGAKCPGSRQLKGNFANEAGSKDSRSRRAPVPYTEFHDILQHFETLYHGPTQEADTLSKDIDITQAEVWEAVKRMSPGKAMPSGSAPAVVWKALSENLAPLIQCSLAFSDEALERVASHCASVRSLLARQGNSLYAKCEGGKQLAGRWCPLELRELVMAIHNQAQIQINHCGLQGVAHLRTGLRQGCSLSPILWALVAGWILKGMQQEWNDLPLANTTFADDFLFKWLISSGRELEDAYRKIREVLTTLSRHGLQV